jgi:hypothetical protein
MTKMKRCFVRFPMFLIIPVFLFSCSQDVLKDALTKEYNTVSSTIAPNALDFKAVQGQNNREVVLTWTNPSSSNFKNVVIKRKAGEYPIGAEDSTATTVYSGTNQKYTNTNLTPDQTYYYAIYALSGTSYSQAVYASKSITESAVDIRLRSFFIFGGSTAYSATPQSGVVSDVDMFDPLTETYYSNITTLPTPRYFCEAASVKNKIYVIGGISSAPASVLTIDIFDVATLTWTSTTGASNLPVARNALRAIEYNDKIYLIGGSTTTAAGGATAVTYRMDPLTTPFTYVSSATPNILKPMTLARVAFSCETYNGIIYHFGGTAVGGGVTSTGYYFNILTNVAETTISGTLPSALVGAASALYHKDLDNGGQVTMFFQIGGGSGSGLTLPITGLTIDASNNVIYTLNLPYYNTTPNFLQLTGNAGVLNLNRAYGGAETYGDYVYIFGGVNASGPQEFIEKLNVNNGSPNSSWQTLSAKMTTAKYAFGITKVKN